MRPLAYHKTFWNPYFNSRPFTRGGRKGWNTLDAQRISTPAPSRGATCSDGVTITGIRFQLPPLHEGRQENPLSMSSGLISTPASTRGATWIFCQGTGSGKISTPAPTQGATYIATFCQMRQTISTPAPSRGATRGCGD